MIGWIAVVWVFVICVMFVLPPVSPVTVDTFNYAPITVLVVFLFAAVSWFAVGRTHFMKGASPEDHNAADPEVLEGE